MHDFIIVGGGILGMSTAMQLKQAYPERRMLLLKVRADDETRTAVLQIVDLFRAHVIHVAPGTVIIESVGTRGKLEALLESLEPYGVREIVQSGAVALGRSPKSLTDQIKEK